jgi:hypothetical protein
MQVHAQHILRSAWAMSHQTNDLLCLQTPGAHCSRIVPVTKGCALYVFVCTCVSDAQVYSIYR